MPQTLPDNDKFKTKKAQAVILDANITLTSSVKNINALPGFSR